jgi:hypothetical protein
MLNVTKKMLNFVVVDDDNAVNVKFNIHVGWKWMYIVFDVSHD